MNMVIISLQVVSPQVHMGGSSEASLSSSPLLSTPLPQPAVTPQHQEEFPVEQAPGLAGPTGCAA